MSVVTGIVICHSLSDDSLAIAEINAWLVGQDKSPLHQLDEKMCNGKHPQMIVWGGGYDFLDDEAFIDFFKNREWKEPDQVFMVFNPENDPICVISPAILSLSMNGLKDGVPIKNIGKMTIDGRHANIIGYETIIKHYEDEWDRISKENEANSNEPWREWYHQE